MAIICTTLREHFSERSTLRGLSSLHGDLDHLFFLAKMNRKRFAKISVNTARRLMNRILQRRTKPTRR